jgi:hypothetical protein
MTEVGAEEEHFDRFLISCLFQGLHHCFLITARYFGLFVED